MFDLAVADKALAESRAKDAKTVRREPLFERPPK